jgi:hypothetical protein
MSRQVVHGVTLRGATEEVDGGGDGYKDKVLKLIPAETVALYVSLQGVLVSALSDPARAQQLQVWEWAIFLIMMALNALYLLRVQHVTDWKQHAIVAAAFIVWAFTLGGPFESLPFYEPFMGSVTLALFTFVVPMFYRGIPAEH